MNKNYRSEMSCQMCGKIVQGATCAQKFCPDCVGEARRLLRQKQADLRKRLATGRTHARETDLRLYDAIAKNPGLNSCRWANLLGSYQNAIERTLDRLGEAGFLISEDDDGWLYVLRPEENPYHPEPPRWYIPRRASMLQTGVSRCFLNLTEG